MSGEEGTPLIYEDSIVSHDRVTSKRKKMCIVAGTICLGIGLCLAIALPITMSSGGSADKSPVSMTSGVSSFFQPLSFSVFVDGYEAVMPKNLKSKQDQESTNVTTSSPVSTTATTTSSSTTASAFSSCPYVLQSRRSSIDIDELNGKLLFELYRVQTYSLPEYTSPVSCSVLEFDLNLSNNSVDNLNGTMRLKWKDVGHFSRRDRSVTVGLEGSRNPPYDWMEIVADSSKLKGQLSLLVQLDGYLLTYECFPGTRSYNKPGYFIHLYSLLPYRGDTGMARALMTLADVWGLNPAEEKVVEIKHKYCAK